MFKELIAQLRKLIRDKNDIVNSPTTAYGYFQFDFEGLISDADITAEYGTDEYDEEREDIFRIKVYNVAINKEVN